MKPAFSVIFLTTLIGAAQGLFLALFTAQSYALFSLLPVQDSQSFYAVGVLLVLIISALGLASSFLHLGRPERAWRSAAMWRTSWLSREVIVLPVFMGVMLLYGLAHYTGWKPILVTLPDGVAIDVSVILGVIGTVLAFALFIATGMVYACMRFMQEWHSPLTVINYILLGGASGFTLAAAFATSQAPELTGFFAGWALIITLLAFASRGASLIRNSRLRPKSTLQTAIGIKHPRIVQKSAGFLGGAFNTREFFHGSSQSTLRSVKWTFLGTVFLAPVLLLMAGLWLDFPGALILAFTVQYLGLLAERWFFFAQVNHPQNLYYQAIS
ncbi:DmsC/YnfH family molybdoenzyme membrane anchor subunit [Rhodoferax sp.]|uniref:dimethyl sulfoxide reductase anchor subunit family protein n=1 Tax=Rhodoferax sp. TaxID=50421 RepID=UPI002606C3B5|nr:DmsC/YnfH family molybdoenzyme membrane anchor subunit [Rhodoferax sp.]MDD2917570.1 dimethyl sulfoxide reductase anchor subunit [Rhodoferax sp.]